MARHQKKMSAPTATVLAFFIALLVCGGIAAGWLLYSGSLAEPPVSDKPDLPPEEPQTPLSVLLVLTDGGNNPQFVCLQADESHKSVQTVALPPQTARSADGDTLAMIFAEEGASACCKEVGNLLNIDTPWFAVMSYDAVEAFIDRLPRGLIYDLQERVTHQTADYYLRLEPGLQTLTGGQTVKLLRYPNWKLGQLQQVKMHAVMVATWWNQYAIADYVKSIDDDYVTWYDDVQTNLTIAPFTDVKEALINLWKQNDGDQCKVVLPNGVFAGNGEEKRYLLKE